MFSVTKDGTEVYKKLLEPVILKRRGKNRTIPALFAILSGTVTRNKVELANRALVDWQVRVRKKVVGKKGCPWFQPSSQATDYKTFLGKMYKEYDWELSQSDFKGFEGSVNAVTEKMFNDRREEWVSIFNSMFYFIYFFYFNSN